MSVNAKRYDSASDADPGRRGEGRARREERLRHHDRLVEEGMYRQANSCARKRKYATFERARAVAEHREPIDGRRLYVYHCDFCGGWHLTHQADQGRYGREAGRRAEEREARAVAEREASGVAEPSFSVGDCVLDRSSDTPCVVEAVGEMGGEPAYLLSSADGCSELGWVAESDVEAV